MQEMQPLTEEQVAWENFRDTRGKKILRTVEEIYNDLISDGFSASPSNRSSALYRALEIVPECKDEEIFKAGYKAALAAKGN